VLFQKISSPQSTEAGPLRPRRASKPGNCRKLFDCGIVHEYCAWLIELSSHNPNSWSRAMIQRMGQFLRVERPSRQLRYSRRMPTGIAAAETLEQRILLSACSIVSCAPKSTSCAPKCDPCAPKESCSTSHCGSSCGTSESGCGSSHSGCCTPPSTPTCNSHDICGQLEAIAALISGCCSSHSESSSCGRSAG
jgi:hypothetical protein